MSAGPSVVLTRAPEDNLPLREALRAQGVPVRELPCTATRLLTPPAPPGPFGAVAFGSRRGVRGFEAAGLSSLLEREPRPLLAAVGPATRAALEALGWRVDLEAEPPTGQALAQALHAHLAPGARVLVPRGDLAGGGLEPALRSLGRAFLPLAVYANEAPPLPALAPFPVAAVFVAAPSAARRLLGRLPWLASAPFLAIGPTTRDAVLQLGAQVLGEAPTQEDQVAQLVAAWRLAAPPSDLPVSRS